MKKIGIDARFWGPKQGGLGRYVEQLVLNLEKLNLPAEFVIFLRQENWDLYNPSQPNFKKVLADLPWYGFAEQTKLTKILNQHSLDLMHFPNWNIPIFYKRPFVVTFHDLLPLHYPRQRATTRGVLVYFFKNLGLKAVLRFATRKSKQIITVSNFSKNDIVQTLKVPSEKISVTYPAPLPPSGSDENIFKKTKITKPYVLYVGVAFPHKNLERLLEAWKSASEINDHYQLVLAGKKNYFYERLEKENAELFKNGSVIFTDFVPDAELSSLYSKASLFILPSLFEGFGIPPLEAMSHNVPVVAARASCLPEVLGDGALYFDPLNTKDIQNALKQGLEDEKLRKNLIKNGQKITSKYSWAELAERTWEIYKNSV